MTQEQAEDLVQQLEDFIQETLGNNQTREWPITWEKEKLTDMLVEVCHGAQKEPAGQAAQSGS